MVSDLSQLKSHPDKLLKTHIQGVCEKSAKRTTSILSEYAALFHDFGKVNPNFQSKLLGEKNVGYSQHSYLSAFAFLNWYVVNKTKADKTLGIESFDITKIKLITAIILHHHGNLPNMDENISNQPFESMIDFLKGFYDKLPVSDYMSTELGLPHVNFDLKIKSWYQNNIPNINLGDKGNDKDLKNWQKDSLNYFLDTQFSFASVIEADKRDAGEYSTFYLDQFIDQTVKRLRSALSNKFKAFDNTDNVSELNKLRTAIRKEAVGSVSKQLDSGKRVFTLTAPTGAGKTLTLLDIAKKIQSKKGTLGVVFALPFLSITEQVQEIIAKELEIDVLSVNSKSYNERIEKAQKEYETVQTPENLKTLLIEDFTETTFDHPFVITTFVQLFETLLSNRNSTLLKLPNFSNRIFLIDEIQALPPRLYVFFSAWLDAFCKRNNSYAVLSTATMPNLNLFAKTELENNKNYELQNPISFFKGYECPNDLLEADKYFKNEVFNRYQVKFIEENQNLESLKARVLVEEKSILVILNTIQDTKDLYAELNELPNVYLLNTHITPEDRAAKIDEVKAFLSHKKVVLISTQLIEAGVDIDFPVVYRDLCPLPSLIQSAGRCNRNGKLDMGEVYFFQFENQKGKLSSEIVYRRDARLFLDFIKKNIRGVIQEKELFDIQKDFFAEIAKKFAVGDCIEEKINLIEQVNKAQFQTVGKFQLINNKTFGEQYQFYVPKNEEDSNFEDLLSIVNSSNGNSYEQSKKIRIDVSTQMKKMSNRIISIRVYNHEMPPLAHFEPVCRVYKLDFNSYTKEEGYMSNKEYIFL